MSAGERRERGDRGEQGEARPNPPVPVQTGKPSEGVRADLPPPPAVEPQKPAQARRIDPVQPRDAARGPARTRPTPAAAPAAQPGPSRDEVAEEARSKLDPADWRADPLWRLTAYMPDRYASPPSDVPTMHAELCGGGAWASLFDRGEVVATWYRDIPLTLTEKKALSKHVS